MEYYSLNIVNSTSYGAKLKLFFTWTFVFVLFSSCRYFLCNYCLSFFIPILFYLLLGSTYYRLSPLVQPFLSLR